MHKLKQFALAGGQETTILPFFAALRDAAISCAFFAALREIIRSFLTRGPFISSTGENAKVTI